MNRRDFLRLTAAGAAALSVPSMAFSADSSKKRPNVLFMAIDDLNDLTGCLGGHPDVKTPNLDKLAIKGVSYDIHYSSKVLHPASAPAGRRQIRGRG